MLKSNYSKPHRIGRIAQDSTADSYQQLSILLMQYLPPDKLQEANNHLEHILGQSDKDHVERVQEAAMAQDRRPQQRLLYAEDILANKDRFQAAIRVGIARKKEEQRADFVKRFPNAARVRTV